MSLSDLKYPVIPTPAPVYRVELEYKNSMPFWRYEAWVTGPGFHRFGCLVVGYTREGTKHKVDREIARRLKVKARAAGRAKEFYEVVV